MTIVVVPIILIRMDGPKLWTRVGSLNQHAKKLAEIQKDRGCVLVKVPNFKT